MFGAFNQLPYKMKNICLLHPTFNFIPQFPFPVLDLPFRLISLAHQVWKTGPGQMDLPPPKKKGSFHTRGAAVPAKHRMVSNQITFFSLLNVCQSNFANTLIPKFL